MYDSPEHKEHDKSNLENIVVARAFDRDPDVAQTCSVMLDLQPIDYKERIDDVVNLLHQYSQNLKHSTRKFLTILYYIHGFCDGTWQAQGEISAQLIIKHHSSLLAIKGVPFSSNEICP